MGHLSAEDPLALTQHPAANRPHLPDLGPSYFPSHGLSPFLPHCEHHPFPSLDEHLGGPTARLCGSVSPLAAFSKGQSTVCPAYLPSPCRNTQHLNFTTAHTYASLSSQCIPTPFIHRVHIHTNTSRTLSCWKECTNSLLGTSKWACTMGIQQQPLASLQVLHDQAAWFWAPAWDLGLRLRPLQLPLSVHVTMNTPHVQGQGRRDNPQLPISQFMHV